MIINPQSHESTKLTTDSWAYSVCNRSTVVC